MFKTPTHVLISWVFLILIGIVFGYSYFFYPNSHPIACYIKEATGKNCATCGFSRAFSLYTHFHIGEGMRINPLSWPVFMFMLLQFFIRTAVVSYYGFYRKTFSGTSLKIDIFISVSGFIFAFLPILLFKN